MRIQTLLIGILVLSIACNDPSSVGASFLEDDEIFLGMTDTFTIESSTVSGDSLLVYTPANPFITRNILAGNLNDPLMGTTKVDIYTQVSLNSVEPAFTGATVDSMFLLMAYDSLRFYGVDTTQPMTIKVFRVTQEMEVGDNAFTNTFYETGDQLGELIDFLPRPRTRLNIIEPSTGSTVDTISQLPHVRVPLTQAFAQEMIDLDTTEFTSQATFKDYFEGIRITVEGEGIMSFNLESSISELKLYYTRSETGRSYAYDISNINKRNIHVVQDNQDSRLGAALNNPADSLVFLQSLGGARASFRFPSISSLPAGLIVNKAELILTQAELPEDNSRFSPSGQIITFTRDSDGSLDIISDVFPDDDTRFISPISGGFLIDDQNNGIRQYRINLTDHIQKMKEGLVSNEILVAIHPESQDASRVVLFGGNSSQHPARLEIVYTINP